MIGFFFTCAAVLVWALFIEGRESGVAAWREIWGGARRLLGRQEQEDVHCRACEKELPDPMFRDAIGHGAFVCGDCEVKINLGVGLDYPDWFKGKLPAEEEPVVQASPETCRMIAAMTQKWPVVTRTPCTIKTCEDPACQKEQLFVCADCGDEYWGEQPTPCQNGFVATARLIARLDELACPNPTMNSIVEDQFFRKIR